MIKKLAILFATLTMVLCCTTTAFAAGIGTITVENPQADKEYKAYKIFDAAKATVGTAETYVYTIKSDSDWYTTVNSYATTEDHGLTLTQQGGTNVYAVNIDETKFNPADFAAKLYSNLLLESALQSKGTSLVSDGAGKLKAENLELGYYFVTSNSGSLCNLTTTKPAASIYDKNEKPKIEKEQYKGEQKVEGSVQVGDTITYEIKGKVPSTTGYKDYVYEITDTMSEGLTFKPETLKVTIGTNTYTESNEYVTIVKDTITNSFKLTFHAIKLNEDKMVGATISVKYDAVVNEKAINVDVNTNTAKLQFSTNPNDSTKKEDQTVVTKVYTAKIVINKINGAREKLAGAKFVLYREDGGTKYYKWNEIDKKVEWVADINQATAKTTGPNGEAKFEGLENGDYWLKEIEAPEGYNLLQKPVKVTITTNKTEIEANNYQSLTVKQEITNKKGALLPETGGIGTIGLTALAVAVVACALFLPKKKNRA